MFKYLIFLCTTHSLFALTTLNVTASSDNNPGGFGDPGELRYCINSMNQLLSTTPDDFAIVFTAPMTIQLNGMLPIINNSTYPVNITIGNPNFPVTIDGNSGSYSGFFIPMGNVVVQNMIFQNLTAKGGDGGDGISGGDGGMGAGAAIYAPQAFLNGSTPSITLINVSVNSCSAIGGNGGNSLNTSTGNEGGAGGGGFSGNGGSITTLGSTGGAGGGGFGGNGGDVTLSTNDSAGGGGGGGGGIGSRASVGPYSNLGNGGSDVDVGESGNGYGITDAAGSGGGGISGGANLGGGGGGSNISLSGGGGGGSNGTDGFQSQGSIPPGGSILPSGGNGGDGGGGGGGGIIFTSSGNQIDGKAGTGGYGGGGGGGSGLGATDNAYTVEGGSGGVGGGGGGGGVNQSGTTSANGGNSLGGGGGGGGGPSNGSTSSGGTDIGNLGGGSGGNGSGLGFAGGAGGGGSGLGGAIFLDSGLNLTIASFSGTPTDFNTINTITQGGTGGTGAFNGSALGNSIFLRTGSSLTFLANDANDLLTLGDQVSFVDDTSFGGSGTSVHVTGKGTVIYNGSSDYQGTVMINNANFKVNGQIDQASISVCRNLSISTQRGTLSGKGTLSGDVFVNSGIISPDSNETLTLGSLTLTPQDVQNNTLGSLVHVEIGSLVAVTNSASLAGTLEIDILPSTPVGSYILLTSSGLTGTFDFVTFTGKTPNYTLSYLPVQNPTYVQLNFMGFTPVAPVPPTKVEGIRCCKRSKLYNILTWQPPTRGSRPTSYKIYRDDLSNLVGIVAANQKLIFKEEAPSKKTTTYYIVSQNGDQTSYPVKVSVRSKYKKAPCCQSER